MSSHRVVLRRYPGAGLIWVSGTDATRWLQGIVTADLSSLFGKAFWGLMLQRNGKVRCELVGIATDRGFWLAVVGGEVSDVFSALDSLILMDDVGLEVVRGRSLWAVHGRGAADDGTLTPGATPTAVATGTLRWFGERDQVYVVDDAGEAAFIDTLRECGLEPSSERDFKQLRVSSGIPQWSIDYSAQDTPHHAALFGRAVALSKGCYVGQEVVCKTEMIGRVSSRLTRLEVESMSGVERGSSVDDQQTGESAGVVTSAAVNGEGPSGWVIARLKSSVIESRPALSIGQARARIIDML